MTPGKTSEPLSVAVLCGGRSAEHEVSLMSAAMVIGALTEAGFRPWPVWITRGGDWFSLRSAEFLAVPHGESAALHTRLDEVDARLSAETETVGTLRLDGAGEGVWGIEPALRDADVVFPVLHGPYGEDGSVQGLLEYLDVPYVGSGVAGSAVNMDKVLMKAVLRTHDLPVAPYVPVLWHEWLADVEATLDAVERQIGYHAFVKPANMGSSIGISRVADRAELRQAVAEAAAYDHRLLVERALDARELECAVLGNEAPEASMAGEIIPGAAFYDYRDKYFDGKAQLLIPAPLDEATQTEIRRLAVAAFRATSAAGLARVDFLLERGTGRPFINELNTMPGFTAISMYPKLWEHSGLSNADLVRRLVDLALQRHEVRARLSLMPENQ